MRFFDIQIEKLIIGVVAILYCSFTKCFAQIELVKDSNKISAIKFNVGINEKIIHVDNQLIVAGISGGDKFGYIKKVNKLQDSIALYEVYDSTGKEVKKFEAPNLGSICIAKDLKYAVYGSGYFTELGTREYLIIYDANGNIKFNTFKPLEANIDCGFINNGDFFYAFADSIENRSIEKKSVLLILNKDLKTIGQAEIVANKSIEKVYLDSIDEQNMVISLKIINYRSKEWRLIKYNYYGVLVK